MVIGIDELEHSFFGIAKVNGSVVACLSNIGLKSVNELLLGEAVDLLWDEGLVVAKGCHYTVG